jgi:uncharacterized protein (DUF2267 family)
MPRTDPIESSASERRDAQELPGRERVALALERDAALPPGVSVEAATSVVLSFLARRLTPGEAHELLEALPPYLHTLFRRAVIDRGHEPVEKLDRAEVVAHVADQLGVVPGRAEAITAAILSAVRAEVPPKLGRDVSRQLPRDLSALWLASSPIAPPSIPGGPATTPRQAVEAEVERRVRLPDHVTADTAIKAVVEIFTQRLSGGEAFDLLLGLPDDLRRLAEGGVLARDEEASVFDRDTFVGAVAIRLRITHAEAEPLVLAVLAAVKRILPVKEIDDVAAQLPVDLRELWLSASSQE